MKKKYIKKIYVWNLNIYKKEIYIIKKLHEMEIRLKKERKQIKWRDIYITKTYIEK